MDDTLLPIIDLRSDTITKPSPEMRTAMMNAEVGDDVFEEDPTVNKLQAQAAELFAKEAALFVPSGTMANEIAINVHTRPGDEVITDDLSHIVHFETGAPGLLSGVNLRPLYSMKGVINANQIEAAVRPSMIAHPRTGLISLENTHNYGGGTVFPISEIKKIAEIAKAKSLPLHLDGARIFNACVATGIDPAEYSKYFDSVTFSLSKGLGAPVGSLLISSFDFIREARRVRKLFGGGMRQIGILAAAGIYALDNNVDRLNIDHKNALILAEAFNAATIFTVEPSEVETNIVIADIAEGAISPDEAASRLESFGILVFPFGSNSIRAVTHMDVTEEDIAIACERIIKHI